MPFWCQLYKNLHLANYLHLYCEWKKYARVCQRVQVRVFILTGASICSIAKKRALAHRRWPCHHSNTQYIHKYTRSLFLYSTSWCLTIKVITNHKTLRHQTNANRLVANNIRNYANHTVANHMHAWYYYYDVSLHILCLQIIRYTHIYITDYLQMKMYCAHLADLKIG